MDMKTNHQGQVIGDSEEDVIRNITGFSTTFIPEEWKIDKSLVYDTIDFLKEIDGILETYVTDYRDNISTQTIRDTMWIKTITTKQSKSREILEKLRKL